MAARSPLFVDWKALRVILPAVQPARSRARPWREEREERVHPLPREKVSQERERKAVKKLLTAVAVAGGVVGSALASPLVEMEPNNTIATANFIPPSAYPTGAFALDGSISPRDVDYISFSLSLGDFVGVTLFDY